MRNYELMRSILVKVASADKELAVRDFLDFGEVEDIREELERLKEEGLIEHNVAWETREVSLGKLKGITPDGRAFLRNIENERVWMLVLQTLKAAGLDLSYPLLKEVTDEIVRRYVMGKIPKEF